MLQYRQGDVLLQKVESLPKQAKRQNASDRIILAHGEVTGHAHAISSTQALSFTWGDQSFILARNGATVVHEEHAPILLEPGFYEVIRQREYTEPTPDRDAYWDYSRD